MPRWLPFRPGKESPVAYGLLSRFATCIVLFVLLGFGLIVPSDSAVAQSDTPSAWKITHQPEQLVNGAPVLFEVKAAADVSHLQANWLGHTILFRQSPTCNCWYGIAGVLLSTKPGRYPLELEATSSSGGKIHYSQPLPVAAATYPISIIKVAPKFVEPPKENMPQIEAEQAVKKDVFQAASPSSEPIWTGTFAPPAEASISGVFGSARVYNGVKKSPHNGLDFRVTTGTPVHASNAGTVILARPLYFEGNCVAVDHGQGLVTLYFHLSEFKVKEGDKVDRGQVLGLSGGTGRATAPHLHFSVRWQGEYLNPATLLKLTPP